MGYKSCFCMYLSVNQSKNIKKHYFLIEHNVLLTLNIADEQNALNSGIMV